MKSFKHLVLVVGIAMSGANVTTSAAVLDSQGFDAPLDSYINVLPGWSQTDNRAYIKPIATHGWDGQTGTGAGIIYPYNKRVSSPALDTSASDEVRIGLDIRPSDSIQGWGGVFRVYVQDPNTQAIGEAITILLDRSSGTIQRTHGSLGSTSIPWVVDEDLVQSLELRLDQANRRYSLIYNDGTQTYQEDDLRWTDLSLGGPTGTFHHMEIQGGSGGGDEQSYPDNWLAFDNYVVTDGTPVPEPGALALVLVGGMMALTRR